MGRIGAGWHLATLSLRVVRSDGSLGVLVVLGGIASAAVGIAFLVPAAVAYSIDDTWLAAIIAVVGVYLATVAGTGATGPFTQHDLERAVARKR